MVHPNDPAIKKAQSAAEAAREIMAGHESVRPPEPAQDEAASKKYDHLLFPGVNEYKNPVMRGLEPDYILTLGLDRTRLTDHQYRHKVSELALRLGREYRPDHPDPSLRNPVEGTRLLREIAGAESEEQELVFYQDDPEQKYRERLTDGFEDLDTRALQENAVEAIERQGKNLQRSTERKAVEDGVLPTGDNSRVREITMRRQDGREVRVVAKRVSLKKVREEPFEEANTLEIANLENLPAPKLVGRFEARGNRYVMMEKVEGMPLNKIGTDVLRAEGREHPDEDMQHIRAEVDRVKELYHRSHIQRDDWDDKDMLVHFDEVSGWKVTPIDFEKSTIKREV